MVYIQINKRETQPLTEDMMSTDYAERFANDVAAIDLLGLGKPTIREQVAEMIAAENGNEDAGDVVDDLWADATNQVAAQIAEATNGDQERIVAWLDDGEPLAGVTLEALVANYLTHLAEQFGTVEWEGKTYTLVQDAYMDNYGTDGGVRYYAKAVDAQGAEYTVEWDTTEEWDDACELSRLEAESYHDNDDIYTMALLQERVLPDVNDESNACDWSHPVRVSPR